MGRSIYARRIWRIDYRLQRKYEGKYIGKIREQKGIPLQVLCKGLCSATTLSRIEHAERLPDKFLFDTLLQRMGKSSDKILIGLTENEYALYHLRERIEWANENGEYQKHKELIKEYAKHTRKKEQKLHRQYLFCVSAISAYEADYNKEEAYRFVKKAIACTLTDIDFEHFEDALYSRQEMLLIMMLAKLTAEMSAEEADIQKRIIGQTKGRKLLADCIRYMERWYTDEEERCKLYPYALLMYAKLLMTDENKDSKNIAEAGEMCEKALQCLAGNNVITGMEQILPVLIACLKLQNKPAELARRERQYQSLQKLYEETGVSRSQKKFFAGHIQTELFLLNETVYKARMMRGCSQEELCDGICEPETISRIERGVVKPSPRVLTLLEERLQLKQSRCAVPLDTDEFEHFEIKREIEKMFMLHNYVEADRIFQTLRKQIEPNTVMNKQYLLHTESQIAFRLNRINREQALTNARKALALTISEYENIKPEWLDLTPLEANIVNQIAIHTYRLGNKEEGIQILQKLIKSYEMSKVDLKYHMRAILTARFNLIQYLEDAEHFEEALELCKQTMDYAIHCSKGVDFGQIIANRTTILEAMKENHLTESDRNEYLLAYQQAYDLSDLMQDTTSRDIIFNYVQQQYGVKLNM